MKGDNSNNLQQLSLLISDTLLIKIRDKNIVNLINSVCYLRANVTIGQTFRGNSSKFNLAHILRLGRP